MKAVTKSGREFALTLSPLPGNRLPKRAGSTKLELDGAETLAPVTSNKGWAKDPSLVLEYIWITLPDGKSYYLTLDYAEKAEAVKDLSVVEGTGPKPAARVTSAKETEAARIAKFKETWASRNA